MRNLSHTRAGAVKDFVTQGAPNPLCFEQKPSCNPWTKANQLKPENGGAMSKITERQTRALRFSFRRQVTSPLVFLRDNVIIVRN
jgi:hypothetical protein